MTPSNIVFGGALSFLLGVASASLAWNIYAVLSIVFLLIIGIIFYTKQLKLWKTFFAFLFLVFLGAFYYHLYLNIESRNQNLIFNEKLSFSGVVSDEPRIYDNYQSIAVELKEPLKGGVRLLTSPVLSFHYGDLISGEGVIQLPDSVVNPSTIAFPKIKVVAKHQGFWLKEKLLGLKSYLISRFEKILPADEEALLAGLTFGYRSDFNKDFRNQMALSGTTHLVALSGYNISILVIATAQVFGYFLSRRKTFYFTALIIFLFVIMVGVEASVVRAAIMGFLALLAREASRIYSMRNAITLTAAAMTLIDPRVLVFNAGFQLSFVSLLGIVYLGPALKKLLKFEDSGFAGWRENVVTTTSAQLAVLPIIIKTFGQFSLTAILANALILEFIPLTMFFGFLLAAVSSLYSYLGFVAAKLAEVLLLYEVSVIKLFAKLSIPIKMPPLAPQILVLLYYAAIVGFIYYFSARNLKSENEKN